MLFSSVLILTSMAAQSQCMEKLKAYVEANAKIQEPAEGKVYFMHFTLENTPRRVGLNAISTDSKIYRGKNKLHFETKDMEVHQDLEDAFLIIHPLKRIVWHNDRKALEKMVPKMAEQQQWILEHSQEQYCRSLPKVKGRATQQVKLVMDELVQADKQVKAVIIDFDVATGQPLKVITHFDKGHQLMTQKVVYHRLDYDHRQKKMTAAKSNVFTHDQNLLPEFQHYELITY